MSLELLKKRFGHSAFTNEKEADNGEKIHEKLNNKFNFLKNIKSLKDNREIYEKLNDKFNFLENIKPLKDNSEIHEKLNDKSNFLENIKSLNFQHQGELEEKEKIIENLEAETSELANEVVTLEKEKTVLLEDLNKSKWMENTVASSTKKMYENKIRTIIDEFKSGYVDSSKAIPLLTAVSRKKQGNQKLNWADWLKIPESGYLFQINQNIAKKIFEDGNVLIDRAIGKNEQMKERRTRGGDEPFNNYSLTFGVGAATTQDDGPYVHTNFNPDTYNLAHKGFTVSYWVKPDVISATSYALGRRAGSSNERFFFGIHNTRINIGIGANRVNLASVVHDMEVDNWYHWVVTFAGQQGTASAKPVYAYINGEVVFSTNWKWTQTGNTGGGENIYFGGRNNNGNFVKGWNFTLDEVAIFDEAKSADWVTGAYNSGRPNDLQNESGLVGYWRFEDNAVIDYSGNDNHGTLTSTDISSYGLPTFSSDVPEE